MKDLIEELYLTNRGFVTEEYQACLDYIPTDSASGPHWDG